MTLKIIHFAQLQVIEWLIGRCEDQFVRAWLITERDLLKNIGTPISRNGSQTSVDYLKSQLKEE